jgi:hypothetical protein
MYGRKRRTHIFFQIAKQKKIFCRNEWLFQNKLVKNWIYLASIF